MMDKSRFKFSPPKILYLLSYLFFVLIIGISCTGYPTKPENPIGYKILFMNQKVGNESEISLINENGLNLKYLVSTTATYEKPVWSTDGNKIAYILDSPYGYQIYIMNSDGTDQHRLNFLDIYCHNPVLSPDGSKIAFISNFEG
ncbi:MAG: hypothetical protein P8048_11730, partial [Calditrichia bacterium]